MKILLYFFARYLLAPLFVAVMIFVLTGIKTIKSKFSLKKLIIFILLASIAVALPSLFGFLKKRIRLGRLDIHDTVLYLPWGIVLQTVNFRFVRSNRYWQLPNSGHSHSNHDMRFRRMVLLSAV